MTALLLLLLFVVFMLLYDSFSSCYNLLIGVTVHDEVGIHRLLLVFILLLGSLFVVRWFGHYDLHWYLFFS